ncbi:MAG TPA: hypothetical protein VKA70_22215 [Blastocatellia bacterium]|nr:hypothetical protein [Blastocatellia bacterium]
MTETTSEHRVSIPRLIFWPAVICLGVTLLRLVGELQNWNEFWFSRAPGGGGSPIGISWLTLVFAAYFGYKLAKAGETPKSYGRVILMTLAGIAILAGAAFLAGQPPIPTWKVAALFVMTIVAIAIQYPAWPMLCKTLLAFGYAVRIPVAILMYFAIRGRWGTHYDVLPTPDFPDTGFWSTYIQIGFLPQMILWIAFTVVIGGLFAGVAAAIAGRGKPAVEAATGAGA